MTNDHIKIWSFYDAPPEYHSLSQNGGDEDWVAFVPDSMTDQWLPWLEEGSSFGCSSVEVYEVEGGEIRIGCHA